MSCPRSHLVEPIGHLAWTDNGPESPPFSLGREWPRCLICDYTRKRDIVPALVTLPNGAPLCSEHATNNAKGYGEVVDLEPPCAECGNPVDEHGAPYIPRPDAISPIRGYLCSACTGISYDADEERLTITLPERLGGRSTVQQMHLPNIEMVDVTVDATATLLPTQSCIDELVKTILVDRHADSLTLIGPPPVIRFAVASAETRLVSDKLTIRVIE